jgi:hypothetical protein
MILDEHVKIVTYQGDKESVASGSESACCNER